MDSDSKHHVTREHERARFGSLDHAAAAAQVKRFAEEGLTEAQIVVVTSWALVDVRRALGVRE